MGQAKNDDHPPTRSAAIAIRQKAQLEFCTHYAKQIGFAPHFAELAATTFPVTAQDLERPGELSPSVQQDLVGWIHFVTELLTVITKLGSLGTQTLALTLERDSSPDNADAIQSELATMMSLYWSLEATLFRMIAQRSIRN